MSETMLLPRTGSTSSDEVTIVEWRVAVGDAIQVGDVVAEVETDKSTVEVESTAAGTVLELCAAELDELSIGDPLLVVGEPGEEVARVPAGGGEAAAPTHGPSENPRAASPFEPKHRDLSDASTPQPPPFVGSPPLAPSSSAIRATPAARRRAREVGADIATFHPGSGPDGRIEEHDVTSPVTPGAPSPSSTPGWAGGLKGVRRTIALRMAQSGAEVVPVTLQRDADVTDLLRWLRGGEPSRRRSLIDAVLVVVARTLVRHGPLNAHLLAEGIVEHPHVNLGYAVDGGRGLIVPVLTDAHAAGIDAIAEQRRTLVEQALGATLPGEATQGATFTVSNLGPFGVESFTPVVNLPQVAILGLGATRRVVDVGEDDELSVRTKLGLSLTFDHRAVDGAPAARFLDDLATTLAEPFSLLL